MTQVLADQHARTRFTTELDRSFSVIAPAGVGKTRAIVERVTALAMSDGYAERLPCLAVVTYTNKAADEMQQRARNRLLEHPGGMARIGAFNMAFFGTIHGFCLNLLRLHGHRLGLPGAIEHLSDEAADEAWAEFLRGLSLPGDPPALPPRAWASLVRHLPINEIAALGRRLGSDFSPPPLTPPVCPEPDVSAVLEAEVKRGGRQIEAAKRAAAAWAGRLKLGAAYLPIPPCPTSSGSMRAAWEDAFGPLRKWLGSASLHAAAAVAGAFLDFRIRRGTLTYDDQVALVLRLLRDDTASAPVRAQGWTVLLDEAQDTDPDQFLVLLELARPPDARGVWIETGGAPPGPGRFCMVGDPQQSIYSSRADLEIYRRVRKELADQRAAGELVFDVTFRCGAAVIAAVNDLAPPMLTGRAGQVAYVPLQARPGAPRGAAVRMPVGRDGDGALRVDEAAAVEAAAIAGRIAALGPAGLGAGAWKEVAVLCARRRWMDPIEKALAAAGVPAVNRSQRELAGDDPAYAWTAALAHVLTHPLDAYQITGVLREVFGISDDSLFAFCGGDGSRFQIRERQAGGDEVSRTLNALLELRETAAQLPLFDAVAAVSDAVSLRERLGAIGIDARPVDLSLDWILTSAAKAESGGGTLDSWAKELRAAFSAERPAAPPAHDALQIMTCHGAKGLEWDTVIVPFIFRPISTSPAEYPLVQERTHRGPAALFSGEWLDEDGKAAMEDARLRELQRLLYVAMTRARRNLVLVDDSTLHRQRGISFASCLGLPDGPGAECWLRLPDALPGEPPQAKPTPRPAAASAPVTAAMVDAARAAASGFPRRVLPHTLSGKRRESEPEQALDRFADSEPGAAGAIEYGLWWHALMEALPWADRKLWDAAFRGTIGSCPEPDRGSAEWKLFLGSDICAMLSRKGVRVATEAPFLDALDPKQCVEGFVDLVASPPGAEPWLVVDWKTDRIEAARTAETASLYAPQIRAYAEALADMVPEGRITALVYFTAVGKHAEIPR